MATKRMQTEDVQALMRIRNGLIENHHRLLDGSSSPQTAMVKQADVAHAFAQAIRNLEEVLATAGGIEFGRK